MFFFPLEDAYHCFGDHVFLFLDKLVVVSYNILGVENASKHQDLYSGVPPKFLEWKRRKRLICKEIRLYDAGIICFQVSIFHLRYLCHMSVVYRKLKENQ